jgi:hypothetical protein
MPPAVELAWRSTALAGSLDAGLVVAGSPATGATVAGSQMHPTLLAMIATALRCMPMDWQWFVQVCPASPGTVRVDPT